MPSTRRELIACGAAAGVLAGCTTAQRLRERLARARMDPPERRLAADWHPGPGTWAQRGYDPETTRHNPYASPPREAPTADWTAEVPGQVHDLVVADGTVYAATTEALVAIAADDGAKAWRESFDVDTVLWRRGRLYVSRRTDDGNRVSALAPDGRRLWHAPVEGSVAPSVIVEREGWVYLPTGSGTERVHADTGKKVDAEYPGFRYVSTRGGWLYTTTGSRFVAYDESFTERWRVRPGDRPLGGAIADGSFVAPVWGATGGGDEHRLVVLDPADGSGRTTVGFEHNPTRAAVVDGTAFVSTYTASDPGRNGGAAAVDTVSGEFRWQFDPGWSCSAPIVADDTVYVPPINAGGNPPLVAFDASGEELWRHDVTDASDSLAVSVAAVGDTLYVGHGHEILALRD